MTPPKLNKYIDALALDTLTAFNDSLDHAKVEFTWCGRRVIRIEGFEGTANLDSLAKKITDACCLSNTQEIFLSPEIAANALAALGKVRNFKKLSADQIKKSWNFFALFINWLGGWYNHFNRQTGSLDNLMPNEHLILNWLSKNVADNEEVKMYCLSDDQRNISRYVYHTHYNGATDKEHLTATISMNSSKPGEQRELIIVYA